MNNWISTKEERWFEKWNNFILADEYSSFIQSIYRIKAYEKYIIDWELLLCIDNEDNILIGSANIIVKLPLFHIYICSCGPTQNPACKHLFKEDEFIFNFLRRGKELNAFASQLTIPLNFILNKRFKAFEGKVFTSISTPSFSNLISLKSNDNWYSKEELIETFTPKGRRDVRASYRKGLTSQQPTSEDQLKMAYLCFEENAKNKGYYVRPWKDMSVFVINSVKHKMAFVITAWHDEKLQGAIFLERSNNTLNYTMGGVYRNTPDLQTGYFLQLEGMLLAKELNLAFYDISFGGPVEVQRFKNMFNPVLIERFKTVYFTNNQIKLLTFNFLYYRLKNIISKLFAIFNKLFS